MSVLDPKAWMPEGMSLADKETLATAHPDDPHLAAALAWEAWAATRHSTGDGGSMGAQSVSTGAQSVAFGDGYGSGEQGEALRRAAWHRARSKPRSVDLGPLYAAEKHQGWFDDTADWDTGTIETYDAGTRP